MKSSYHLKEDGFEARWVEGTGHRDKAIIWMHGSGMSEKHCLADSESAVYTHIDSSVKALILRMKQDQKTIDSSIKGV